MKRRFLAVLAGLSALASSACSSLSKEARELPPMSFEGDHTFGTLDLREVVAAEVGEAVEGKWERSAVDDGAFAIERFYARQGFGFARVDWNLVHVENKPDRAVFHIEENSRVAFEDLEFVGASSISRRTMEEFFPKPSRSVAHPVWWVESRIANAAKDLEDYFYKNGYLDARVSEPVTSFDAKQRHARVRVEVVEGVLSRITKIALEGGPEDIQAALQRAADAFTGRPYSPLVAGAVRGQLEEVLAARGYADGKASAGTPERGADGATAVTFTIVPGPRVRIASVEIRGAKRTQRDTVLELLKLNRGDFYSSDKERESFRALYQSGLFSSVRVSLAPGSEEERVLIVELNEANAVELYVEPGYGSYERVRVGLGGRLKNLFGTGRSLDIDGSLAELAQRGRVSLITPRVFGTDIRSTFSVFANRREEPSFTSRENGLAWNFARRLSRRLSATLGYEFRSTSVSDVDVIGPQVQALIDAVEISSVALTPVFDTRDSVFVPSKGGITKLTYQVADGTIGSELDFLRLRFAHSTYLPVWDDGVLAVSWRTGLIVPTHNSDSIPLQERFFNGGENTVRSFREDQLGPTDVRGNPLGGEVYHVFSIELRQKLTGNLDAGLFFDTGNVQLDHNDFFESTGFRDAIGIGLRYVLPIGPIRLDLGFNPDPDNGESPSVLHFTVGMAF
ncbi:MAG: BamA/TamA family outer membrane protein [Planctomycetota bacterium]